jgi:hypothetical protein
MLNPGTIWRRSLELLPRHGFHFDRPLLLIHSDDWGRAGLRDQAGLEQLRSAGIRLGERPYDFYTLETAQDVSALHEMLEHHRDSTGHAACVQMNFVQTNLDLSRMQAENYREIHLLPLSGGLPPGWDRPGLFDAYREGMAREVFQPALHGTTHFCRRAVERHMADSSEPGQLLRTLWEAGTPYIYWRMPWIGYEYWDPSAADERFLATDEQTKLIGMAVGAFSKMFSTLPHSACAPGYRANSDTHKAWVRHGIHVAQNGPGSCTAPHFNRDELLHVYRTIEFEPAVNRDFSLDAGVKLAEECFDRGIPAIASVHSINFHSSVKDFRSRTLSLLDKFLSALEARHDNLLYLHDQELSHLVQHGCLERQQGPVHVRVTKQSFIPAMQARGVEA